MYGLHYIKLTLLLIKIPGLFQDRQTFFQDLLGACQSLNMQGVWNAKYFEIHHHLI